MENKITIRPAEAAQLLSISKRKFDGLRAAGGLPEAIKLGGCLLYKVDDLRLWVQLGCPSTDDFKKKRGLTNGKF